jgi:hypothetical protein
MPKYGFKGHLKVTCTREQTETLLKMLERQGVQPAKLGRELVVAACNFLDAGGRLEFPLRVLPAEYHQIPPALYQAAEDPPRTPGLKPASRQSPGAA